MGNCLYRFMLSIVRSNARRVSNEMSTITADNFVARLQDKETPRTGLLTRYTRWRLTPTESVLPDFKKYSPHVDSRDALFAFSYDAINIYFSLLRNLRLDKYWQSDAQMEAALRKWDPTRQEPQNQYPLQEGFISFEGMDWFFNTSAELFHQLEREGDYFYIDTTFLNDYEHKPEMRKIGSRGYFLLVNGKLELQSVNYENKLYLRRDTSDEAKLALRAFYGSYSLIRTILTHAIGIHWKSSVEFIGILREFFPITHPLRQVFMPIEMGAFNGLTRAAKTLLSRDGFFHTFGPFTYKGMCQLIHEYVRDNDPLREKMAIMQPRGLEEYKKWHLSPNEVTALPFRGLDAWIKHIYAHAEEYVDTFIQQYPNDTNLMKWYRANSTSDNRMKLIRTLGALYMLQIIHSTVAAPSLFYIFATYSYILRKDGGMLNSQSRISTHFMQIVVDESTAEDWFRINLDLSPIITNPACREVWHRFYEGMDELSIDTRIKMYQPANVPGSTGL